jgi:hypothetical protein
MTNFTDCQDEYPGRPRPLRARQDRDYCAAFVLDLERIRTLSAPLRGAIRLARVAMSAGDPAALQNAMGEIAEAARAFQKIEGIAALAGTRIAIHRRRDTRVRG